MTDPGETLDGFVPPPRPDGLNLRGRTVRLEPLDAARHGKDLFDANMHDTTGTNWEYLSYGRFPTLDAYTDWIAAYQGLSDPVFFAIIRKSDDRAVGVASYLRIDPANGAIEVGHINFSPLLQRTVEGTEAMFLMMEWAFENGYRRYEWKCNARNRRSRAAAERLGFSYEGVFRQAAIIKGRNRDTAWFAMIDKEWPEIRACFQTYLDAAIATQEGQAGPSLSALTKPLLYKRDDMALSQ